MLNWLSSSSRFSGARRGDLVARADLQVEVWPVDQARVEAVHERQLIQPGVAAAGVGAVAMQVLDRGRDPLGPADEAGGIAFGAQDKGTVGLGTAIAHPKFKGAWINGRACR
jgi:hypothetical protein